MWEKLGVLYEAYSLGYDDFAKLHSKSDNLDHLLLGKRISDEVISCVRMEHEDAEFCDWHIDLFDGKPVAWYGAMHLEDLPVEPPLAIAALFAYDYKTRELTRHVVAVDESELLSACKKMASPADKVTTFGIVVCHAIKVVVGAPDPSAAEIAKDAIVAIKFPQEPETLVLSLINH